MKTKNRNIFKTMLLAALPVAAVGMLAACSAEPDDSDIYTSTGFTIEEYLSSRDNLANFNYIVQRAKYDRILDSYGAYTCFAPTNDAVIEYIDSLFNDSEAELMGNPHNGMTANSLEGLSDSLCLDIVLYHIAGSDLPGEKAITIMDMSTEGASKNINSLLGRPIRMKIDDVYGPMLNDEVLILNVNELDEDKTAVNGIVHQINKVLPRSNKVVTRELETVEGYEIFYEALKLTGLADSLKATEKEKTVWEKADYDADHLMVHEEYVSELKYTVFAESDEVLAANGINNIDQLIAHANSVYGGAASWYNYLVNPGIWSESQQAVVHTVNTETDKNNAAAFKDRNNALNMFMAYHLLRCGLANDIITTYFNVVPSDGSVGWSGDSYDYYVTMLPNTLVKAWNVRRENKTYLNRWVENNTLTDGLETLGSASMHTLRNRGIEIKIDEVMSPRNGFIYPIDGLLEYTSAVPGGVLKERLRIDWLSVLPEIINNGWRRMYTNDVGKARIRFANDFFDDIKVYNGNNTHLGMNVRASLNTSSDKSYSLYQGDSFRGSGVADFAIKLPPVPEGDYELRVDFTMASHFGIVQYYIGTSSDPYTMEALDIPMDCRMSFEDPRIGWTNPMSEEDYNEDKGYTSDKDLRNRNWMRGLLSLVRENQKTSKDWIVRFRTDQVRRILTRRHFTQGDYWLRVKSVLTDNPHAVFQLDYVEFMPTDLLSNPQYFEDMY